MFCTNYGLPLDNERIRFYVPDRPYQSIGLTERFVIVITQISSHIPISSFRFWSDRVTRPAVDLRSRALLVHTHRFFDVRPWKPVVYCRVAASVVSVLFVASSCLQFHLSHS